MPRCLSRGENERVNRQFIDVVSEPDLRGLIRRFVRFARSTGPPALPSSGQIAADIALAAAVGVASLATVIVIAKSTAASGPVAFPSAVATVGWRHGAVLAATARAAPLAVRRLRPLLAYWLCLAACLLQTGLPGIVLASFIALVPAAYSAVAYSRYRGAALLCMPAAVIVLASSAVPNEVAGNYLLLTAVILIAPAVIAAHAMRGWRQRADESAARLTTMQAEHENATRQAVAAERARIASELHDVVTHNVSMMVVQAGGARRVLAAEPDQARSALLAIEESGRSAIVELQHLLGLLVQPEYGDLTGLAGSVPLEPQPGLDRLQPLIDRVAATGLPVELKISGDPRPLPPGVDLAAYRVIQEALTNVMKHAGMARTLVAIDYQTDGLTIDIADKGSSLRPGSRSAVAGSGRGLVGLRERVSMYGGELQAGRRTDGGWRVLAQIPDQRPLRVQPAPS
jgi:signal transduction histidine kinase